MFRFIQCLHIATILIKVIQGKKQAWVNIFTIRLIQCKIQAWVNIFTVRLNPKMMRVVWYGSLWIQIWKKNIHLRFILSYVYTQHSIYAGENGIHRKCEALHDIIRKTLIYILCIFRMSDVCSKICIKKIS